MRAECDLDVVNADVVGGHEAGVELHPHGEFLGAIDEHLRYAVDHGDALRHHGLAIFVYRREG